MKDERVKPCPFCGGDAEVVRLRGYILCPSASHSPMYYVACTECGCRTGPDTSVKDIIEIWNKRDCGSKNPKTDSAKLVFPNGAVIEEDINNTDDVSKLSFNSAAKALSNLSYNDKKIYINMLLDAFFKGENNENKSENKND